MATEYGGTIKNISNNPPAVIGVGRASSHSPTLTPCLRKPAAEAEAETGLGDGWETSGERLPDVSQSWPGRAGGEGDKREPRCSKVIRFALLANFSHFCSGNAKMLKFCSKANFFHFWPPKVAKYRYFYKPFCSVVQKVQLFARFRANSAPFGAETLQNDFSPKMRFGAMGSPLPRLSLEENSRSRM